MSFDVDTLVAGLSDLVAAWGLRVAGALAVLVFGLLVARVLRSLVRRGLERSRLDATLVPFLSGLLYYAVVAIVLVAALGLVGVQTASVVALLGAAGLAVGLALQGTLAHFAAGILLLWFRPFRVGDFVDIAGTAGTVGEVGILTTTLNTPDNVRILVPNGKIWGAEIKNYNANPTRRVDLVVGVSYDDDLALASEVIGRVVKADARVLAEPAPVVAVDELADSSVNFVVRPWVKKDDYWTARWDLTRALKEQLEAAGCSIPYPQRDVHLQREATES